MADPQFWKDLQAEFDRLSKEYPDLDADFEGASANFDTTPITWRFTTASGKDRSRAEDEFKAVTVSAAIDAGLCAPDDPEPWRAFLNSMLDHMRRRGWEGVIVRSHYVRTEQEYTFGDEWKDLPPSLAEPNRAELELERFLDKVEAPLTEVQRDQLRELEKAAQAEGEARRLKALEVSEALQSQFHWLQNGSVERVFEAVAAYWTMRKFLFRVDGSPKNVTGLTRLVMKFS